MPTIRSTLGSLSIVAASVAVATGPAFVDHSSTAALALPADPMTLDGFTASAYAMSARIIDGWL